MRPESFVRMKGKKIPRVLLGTSPFIGAGQFGFRSLLYYRAFYDNPERIARIICKSYEIGVRGIQVLPYSFIIKAIKEAEKSLDSGLIVVGSIEDERDIEMFKDVNTVAVLTHASVTDVKDVKLVYKLLDKAKDEGYLTGVATHKPYSILKWIRDKELKMDLLMLPINKEGIFADGDMKKIVELIEDVRKDKIIIAKKALAAGRLKPETALKYVAEIADVVAIGVASEKEAEESFSIALRYFRS
ncbi:hypothetical protein DRN86_01100 [Candidatus Geothermarchaeota archaeon]|nr:MAG: hypothetical protein DRN86_01100 [Candidatus Geothermarchaeota archaeon]